MAISGTINARLPEGLKRHGMQVLDREGVSVSQAVRSLFEFLETEQTVPSWMVAEKSGDAEVEANRRKLRSLVGVASVPAGFDAKKAFREEQLQKCQPGVRA